MAMPQTFKKQERLCSFTAINDLVNNGVALFHYPFRVVYKVTEELAEYNLIERVKSTDCEQIICEKSIDCEQIIYEKALDENHVACMESLGMNQGCCNKILVSVPKKNFKRAVKRNLLKRRIRECYRRNKELLELPQYTHVNFMLVYVSKDILDYSYMERKLKEVLERISKEANEQIMKKLS